MAAVSLRSDYSRHVCASYLGVDVRFSKFITPRVSLVVFMEMSAFDQKRSPLRLNRFRFCYQPQYH